MRRLNKFATAALSSARCSRHSPSLRPMRRMRRRRKKPTKTNPSLLQQHFARCRCAGYSDRGDGRLRPRHSSARALPTSRRFRRFRQASTSSLHRPKPRAPRSRFAASAQRATIPASKARSAFSSTASINHAPALPLETLSTLSVSKFCAARRARCSVATPRPVH
jgi:hypothetical protein